MAYVFPRCVSKLVGWAGKTDPQSLCNPSGVSFERVRDPFTIGLETLTSGLRLPHSLQVSKPV